MFYRAVSKYQITIFCVANQCINTINQGNLAITVLAELTVAFQVQIVSEEIERLQKEEERKSMNLNSSVNQIKLLVRR